MTIQIDSREKARAITKIIAEFNRQGIKHFVSKLPVADYMSFDNPRLVIDRKQNLNELCTNISSMPKRDTKTHKIIYDDDGSPATELKRFNKEMQLAFELGIRIIFLCEHGEGIKSLDDVRHWINPRIKGYGNKKPSPLAVSGERLHRILCRLQHQYGVVFLFCSKAETGKRIIELLGGGHNDIH